MEYCVLLEINYFKYSFINLVVVLQKNVHDNLISMEVKNEVAWIIVSSVITLYSGKDLI
jgi:hypothetical protein